MSQDRSTTSPGEQVAGWVRSLGTAALVAAVASRNLFPAEDASDGTGVLFFPLAWLCGLCLVLERTLGVRSPRLWVPLVGFAALVCAWFLSARFAEYQHPAELMAWEWVATALVGLYAFHRAFTEGARSIAALAIALGLTQGILALHEATITTPRLREMYRLGDAQIIEAMRSIGVAPGTPAEEAFRQRLFSSEPFGTTGHPNSLAGLLVVVLPLAFGLAFPPRSAASQPTVAARIGSIGILSAITATLLATKSRTAWIAAVVGLFVWLFADRGAGRRWRRTFIVASVGLAAVVGLVVVWTSAGILDREVVTESFRSFEYRWEWWQGSAHVVAESPWIGVGPGNFRSHYLAYKLPFSSEEIADPHNFIIELLATGGLLATAAYLGLMALAVRGLTAPPVVESGERTPGLGVDRDWWVGVIAACVAVAGLEIGWLALIAHPGDYPALWAFPVAALGVTVLQWLGGDWRERSLRAAVLAGLVGVHVHWLGAGGVAFPSMMFLLAALVGSAAGWARPSAEGERGPSFAASAFAVSALSAITFAHAFFAFSPRVERDLELARVRTMEGKIAREEGSLPTDDIAPAQWRELVPLYEEWTSACRRTALAEVGDRVSWERLAVAEAARMRALARLRLPESAGAYTRAVEAWQRAIALEPRRSESHRQLAKLHREAAAVGIDPNGMGLAAEELRRSVALYPNSAVRNWELGDLLSVLNRRAEAVAAFERALELDQTPHLDKRLSDLQRMVAEKYVGPSVRREKPAAPSGSGTKP